MPNLDPRTNARSHVLHRARQLAFRLAGDADKLEQMLFSQADSPHAAAKAHAARALFLEVERDVKDLQIVQRGI